MEVSTWFCNNSHYYEDSNSEKQSTTSTTYEENTSSSCSIDTFNISPNSYCIATFKTLTPQISNLAIHNNILYAASLNKIVAIDLKTYELIDTFTSSSFGLVKSIAFTKTKILAAHQDCKIRIWQFKPSSKKHHLLSTLPKLKDRILRGILPKNYVQIRRHKQKLWIQHVDTVSGLAVNDGLMYSVSWDKTLKIWKMSDFSCLESVLGHVDAINAVVVSQNGVVYTASADGEIKVWRREKNKHSLVTTLRKHKSSVNAMSLNNDGTILFSGGCDKKIVVWEKEEHCVDYYMLSTCLLKGHNGAILCLNYFDGVLISGSSDRSVRIWEKNSINCNNNECGYVCSIVLEGHCKPVKSITAAWDADENGNNNNGILSVFSGSLDGEIRVWQVNIVQRHINYSTYFNYIQLMRILKFESNFYMFTESWIYDFVLVFSSLR